MGEKMKVTRTTLPTFVDLDVDTDDSYRVWPDAGPSHYKVMRWDEDVYDHVPVYEEDMDPIDWEMLLDTARKAMKK